MNAAPHLPPAPPAAAWSAPPTPPRRTLLGIDRQLWLLAWLPVLPSLFLAALAPQFLSPLLDARVAVAGIPAGALVTPLLALVNLVAARINRTLGYISISLTTMVGIFWAILGPAVVLILINLST